MFLIDLRCDAGALAAVAAAHGWRHLLPGVDAAPHLVLLSDGSDAAVIRAAANPGAAAPIVLIADAGVATRPGVDEVVVRPVDEAAACAILERWRPDPTDLLDRIEATLGAQAVGDMLRRLSGQLETAFDDASPAAVVLRAHRLAGISGMLGFTALGDAWLGVERGAPDAVREARIQTRRALAAIARRLY
jgi:HPt (histidine-containing phosphotransfer) domain-containing protein